MKKPIMYFDKKIWLMAFSLSISIGWILLIAIMIWDWVFGVHLLNAL